MATSSVAFHLYDPRAKLHYGSRKIQRICYRCDTRPRGEIFHGGFASREIEDKIKFAAKLTRKAFGVQEVMNPVEDVPSAYWNKPLVHPFAPGTEAAAHYEENFERKCEVVVICQT